MKTKLFTAAVVWTGVGLAGGLYYREFTKAQKFDVAHTFTQLGLVHTHALTLGTLVMLLALICDQVFDLARKPRVATAFLYTWNIGLALATTMMIAKGTLQILGHSAANHAAIAGISGLGHMGLTAGFVLFFITLHAGVTASTKAA